MKKNKKEILFFFELMKLRLRMQFLIVFLTIGIATSYASDSFYSNKKRTIKDEDNISKVSLNSSVIDNSIDNNQSIIQQITIKGKIIDKNNQPLPGVNIIIKGTNTGTISDKNGNFSIDVSRDAKILVFTFVGMKTQEVEINGRTSIDIVMETEAFGIDEVVAIGYGTARRMDLTGSISSVTGSKIKDIPVSSAADAIVGQMPGVHVWRTEGSPDAEIIIRVRGGGSITQDNSPLYLVDGFPVDNINDIAPTDIQSIDVLKDASSTAIYGARGANGVILVTTKSGFEGIAKGKVSFNTYYGIKKPANLLDMMDPYNYVLWQYEAMPMISAETFFGDYRDVDLYKEMKGTNWQKECLPGGSSWYNNISFNGGSRDTKYNVSLTRNDEDEVLINSSYKRTNLMIKVTQKVNDWLTIDLNSTLSDYKQDGNVVSSGGMYGSMLNIMQFRPIDGIEDYVDPSLVDPKDFEAEYKFIANPVNTLNDTYRKTKRQNFRINGAANIKLLKDLTYRFEYGQGYNSQNMDIFYGMNTYRARMLESPVAEIRTTDSRSIRMSNVMTYDKDNLLPGSNLNIIVGQEFNNSKNFYKYNYADLFPRYIDAENSLKMMQLGSPQISTTEYPKVVLSSFFGRVNYNYKKKYFASATLRADGSSKFAPGNRWGYFPSFGVSWNINEEEFLKDLSWLSFLKLRASYGEAGNNRISDDAWRKTFSVKTGQLSLGNFDGYTPFIAVNPILSNNSLKWETTITKNIGLDFGLWKGRLSGTVEFYKNVTKDLLVSIAIPASTGYSSQWQNIGQTSNKGVEVKLDGIVIDEKDFKLMASFNVGINKNRIDNLGDLEGWAVRSGLENSNDYIIKKGEPVGLMYGYVTEGMYTFDDFDYNPETKVYTIKEGVPNDKSTISAVNFGPGTLKLMDTNNDSIVSEADKVVIGNANPKHTGGINLSAQYKGFDLSAFFNWTYGNDVYYASKLFWTTNKESYWLRNLLSGMSRGNSWRRFNTETGLIETDPEILAEINKGVTLWSPHYTTSVAHSWMVEDGSFLRLNNLTIGYTLPSKLLNKIGIDRLRIYATGYNLWIWTNYTGFDPEVSTVRSTPLTPGVDYCQYPRSRTYNIGLNVEF